MQMYYILTAALLGGLLLGLWTLFGETVKRLPLRCVPLLVARQRLKRFILSGRNARVVCFGALEKGEDPGFHFVFDAALCGKLRLDTLMFSDIKPPSALKMAADYCGRTVEAYCYCGGHGLQLIGTLGQEASSQQFCLLVQKIKLSGRQEELFIRAES